VAFVNLHGKAFHGAAYLFGVENHFAVAHAMRLQTYPVACLLGRDALYTVIHGGYGITSGIAIPQGCRPRRGLTSIDKTYGNL
jgi:hypothetical protein